jgi:hypothetical protein
MVVNEANIEHCAMRIGRASVHEVVSAQRRPKSEFGGTIDLLRPVQVSRNVRFGRDDQTGREGRPGCWTRYLTSMRKLIQSSSAWRVTVIDIPQSL